MSYSEYNDMFIKCQSTAPYKLYIYDLVNSSSMANNEVVSNLQLLIYALYMKIKSLEIETNTKILHQSDLLNYTKLQKREIAGGIYYYLKPERTTGDSFINSVSVLEPFLISGDCIGFTVNRGTISDELVDRLFEETKKELNINYQFHKSLGYYETDNWIEGDKKYYRGYAINLLSTLHKMENKVLQR
ncbi:MAG: hypothetical protein PHW32_01365 [Bacilli bacterium]|nr:hypothetical protein [Bacilli bacterium]MDD4282341.1 hypothetical protein [Bacilli bacterium]MDD4718968.1 hypothetical protein [Bacilli bacterium]